MKALLIIDMQVGGFRPETSRFDTEGVIYRINQLAKACRQQGHPVIFIQHDGTKENEFIPGTADWELLPSLQKEPQDIVVGKTANDPFYQSALQNTLDSLGIKELILMGWATDYCVDSAVRSALSRDFSVVVVKDGHTTGDRPHLKAGIVIQHHNWLWESLIPTRGSVRVVPFEILVESLNQESPCAHP